MNLHLDANAVVEWERGRFDLPAWIAQNRLEDNATLLTFDREHFSRVPGLRLAAV